MPFDNNDQTPTDAEVRAAVVSGLRLREDKVFKGYHGLEFMPTQVALQKITLGSIFATVGELATAAGRPGDYSTIKGVMVDGLGVNDLGEAHNLAHEIGCDCANEPLTGDRAARAIEAFSVS